MVGIALVCLIGRLIEEYDENGLMMSMRKPAQPTLLAPTPEDRWGRV